MSAVEFRVRPHELRECDVVEVWIDGEFKATITPADLPGVRIVSRHMTDVLFDRDTLGVVEVRL